MLPQDTQAPKDQLMMMRVSQRLVPRSYFNDIKGLFKTWFPEAGNSPKAVVAVRYGKTFLMTPGDKGLTDLIREDLVDIADYDPARNSLLYIGKGQPGKFAPLLWFIFRTFPDVNAVVLLDEDVFASAGIDGVGKLEADLKHLYSDTCLAAMPYFKDNNTAWLSTGEAVFLFNDLKKAESVLKKALIPA